MSAIPTGTVTFLFTDIEGSTKLWENYPVQMEVDLARHDRILGANVEACGGYVFKWIGDACCAAFAHPREALRAALAAQRALFAERWSEPINLRVRMALHTGAAEEREGDYFGPPLNRVSRLLAAAHGGQVLLSGAIHNLVRDHPQLVDEEARLVDLGEHRLKDLTHPEQIYQLAVSDLPERFPPLRADRTPDDFDSRYRFKDFLGSGGMAKVYLAHDEELERDVAIKVLHPRYVEDEQFVERFKREARSAAKLSHPNIVPIYDRGEKKDGTYYMVMEHLPGGTLKECIVKEAPLPIHSAAELTLQVARALEIAHRKGIIHRDIKPQNILMTESGEAKVADFGIAKAASATTSLTRTGLFMGTPQYISPEQTLGQPVSPKSDLYALGVVLYEMLTGEIPYDAETPVAIAMKQIHEPLRSPREINPNVPERVTAVTERLLAKDPNERYPDAAALIDDLKLALRSLEKDETVVVQLPSSGNGEVSADTIMEKAGPPPTVRVPDLTGKSVFLVSSELADMGLTLGDQNEVSSDTVPKGGIIGQSPEAGTEVGPDSMVSVTVSLGPPTVEVPDLAERSRSEASSALAAAGLKLGNQSEAPNDDVPEGGIVGQEPTAGTEVNPGSSVSVTISSGPSVVEVPDLAGRSRSEARRTLAAMGLKLDYQSEAPSDDVPEGGIVGQYPAAGTEVDPGSSVSVTISSGLSIVEVPELAGRGRSEASSTLAARGLRLGYQGEAPSDDVPEGGIVGQYPVAGTKVNLGSSVSVTVSLGSGENTATVPDVSGRSLEEARRILEGAGLVLARSRKEKKSFKSAGTVISTDPPAGSKVALGTSITPIVSSGLRISLAKPDFLLGKQQPKPDFLPGEQRPKPDGPQNFPGR